MTSYPYRDPSSADADAFFILFARSPPETQTGVARAITEVKVRQ
jgi:hypothetical protein